MTITDHDMREQVKAALTSYVDSFDVEGIVNDLQAQFGTVDVETIDSVLFWRTVGRHDVENVPPHRAAAVNTVQYPDVTVQLTGEEGNGAIIGRDAKAIRRVHGAEADVRSCGLTHPPTESCR
jgi:hypothetical protein